jgi:hypothetical protein
MRLHPILCLNRVAVGAILPYRIITAGVADDAVAQSTAGSEKLVAVSGQLGCATTERLDVYYQGCVPVEYGGTIANGDPITADADGRAVKAGPDDTVIGHAMEAGAADEIGSVLLGGNPQGGLSGAQVVTGTLAAGTCTIAAGITVTAATRAFPTPTAAITGTVNFGGLAHKFADNVAGAPGVGAVTIIALGDDGAQDADAAGTFQALLLG